MPHNALPCLEKKDEDRRPLHRGRAITGFVRFVLLRVLGVLLTVAIGVYVAIWVSQIGGYADESRRQLITAAVAMGARSYPGYRTMTYVEKQELMDEAVRAALIAADLDKPFIVRSIRHLTEALSLSLGTTRYMTTTVSGSHDTREVLLERLPMTLLLFGAANLITYFGSLFMSLILARRYGGFLDRLTTALMPILIAPPWFHGIFLIVIFAAFARLLPFGGVLDTVPETQIGYILEVLKHMILPVTAWVLGTLPFATYSSRAFFLLHSTEEYVELAKAKGLSPRRIERNHILRPALPRVITNFAIMMITAWQGAILTELVFNWPGLGRLLFQAIMTFEVPVTIGAVVIFAYLLAMTVLILDIVYALVDPRVKLGAGGRA